MPRGKKQPPEPQPTSGQVLEQTTSAALIREWHRKNPMLTAKEIRDGLYSAGREVSMAQVYGVLATEKARASNENGKVNTKPRGRKRKATESEFTLEQMLAAKRAVAEMGGIEAAKEALAAFAQLVA
jgi:hypothetical protein